MNHPVCGFEHLHNHTCVGSLLDGISLPEECAERVKEIGQKFLCISDHGMLSSVPRQIKSSEKNGLSPIFAIEIYLNPMQPAVKNKEEYTAFVSDLDEEQKKKLKKSYHLTLIAYNEEGYKNLVNLSSWAWINGQGGNPRRPRINYEQLIKHKEGLFALSGCYAGHIGWTFDQEGPDAAMEIIEKYMAMFGDKFYLEIMMLDFAKQKPYDAFLIKAHDKYHIPLVLTNDSHYSRPTDANLQKYMLMVKTGNTIANMEEKLKNDPDADFFELQDTNLWMKSEDELNQMWEAKYSDIIPYELYKEAKSNSVKICEMSKGVELDRSLKLPQIPDADGLFKEAIKKGFVERHLPKTKVYLDRIREEYDLICKKGFSSYFLIQKQMTDEARRMCPTILGWGDGNEAVGPGRGSAVSALTCYCLGITDVDPVKHDLLFSRFLSENRGGKSLKLKFTIDPEE